MCGLIAILNIDAAPGATAALRQTALDMAAKIRHRGPDCSGIFSDAHAVLTHERLAFVDVEHGAQPLVDAGSGCVLTVNGEIYNHHNLRQLLCQTHDFQTASDCEVILYLYDEWAPQDFLNRLNGIFAFVLYIPRRSRWLIARDPIGVIPLYLGWDAADKLYVSSEMKALVPRCERIVEFPPGHFFIGDEQDKGFQRYYEPGWAAPGCVPDRPYEPTVLREALVAAVRRQLMSEVPFGVLVSGGVDSSLVAAIAALHREGRVEAAGVAPSWRPRIHSFSIGLEGAPDLAPARRVAEHIGAVHHEIHFTVQEGLDTLSEVIYRLETFDITTIRAATPMYLLMRNINALGNKMVLSGEGADEIFGGYLYFHKTPHGAALHQETVRKLRNFHLYDCARANKSGAAWGIEVRVPFLDRKFLDVAMNLAPRIKLPNAAAHPQPIEKWPLRNAFAGYLPDDVLWRQKEQFSDGVGYAWIAALKSAAERQVSDRQMAGAAGRFPVKTPENKEAYLYRRLFEQHFPAATCVPCVPFERSVACGTAIALESDAAFMKMIDPSGRAVADVHVASVSRPTLLQPQMPDRRRAIEAIPA